MVAVYTSSEHSKQVGAQSTGSPTTTRHGALRQHVTGLGWPARLDIQRG